jgi:hypothetical protein
MFICQKQDPRRNINLVGVEVLSKLFNFMCHFIRGDQEGLFKLVTLDRILNRITGVTFGWWLVVVNAVPIGFAISIETPPVDCQFGTLQICLVIF